MVARVLLHRGRQGLPVQVKIGEFTRKVHTFRGVCPGLELNPDVIGTSRCSVRAVVSLPRECRNKKVRRNTYEPFY